jgi:hypothetical protein
MPQFGAPLTDDARSIIHNRNVLNFRPQDDIQHDEIEHNDNLMLSVGMVSVVMVRVVAPIFDFCHFNQS